MEDNHLPFWKIINTSTKSTKDCNKILLGNRTEDKDHRREELNTRDNVGGADRNQGHSQDRNER